MRRFVLVLAIGLMACGGRTVELGGDGGPDVDDGGTPLDDGGNPIHPDGMVPVDCVSGGTECSDCIDNDHDGDIDGFDVECTGAIDDDEGSFATGINGDNMDLVNQDCFFDGNSGAGDDRCNRHVCCLLGLDAQECDDGGYDNNYDPIADCPPQDQDCLDNCAPLAPPGCDCFGCCTVCDDDGCVDIYINPTVAPDCDETTIHEPAICPVCTQAVDCTTGCTDTTECQGSAECPDGQFCAQGCCIFVVD